MGQGLTEPFIYGRAAWHHPIKSFTVTWLNHGDDTIVVWQKKCKHAKRGERVVKRMVEEEGVALWNETSGFPVREIGGRERDWPKLKFVDTFSKDDIQAAAAKHKFRQSKKGVK